MRLEVYTATVRDNNDPAQQGRIKVSCPGLLGDDTTVLPMWIPSLLPWGLFVVPYVGEIIEIEVQVSSDSDQSFQQGSIDSLNPRWRGARPVTDDEVDGQQRVNQPPWTNIFTAGAYPYLGSFFTNQGDGLMWLDASFGQHTDRHFYILQLPPGWAAGDDLDEGKIRVIYLRDDTGIVAQNQNSVWVSLLNTGELELKIGQGGAVPKCAITLEADGTINIKNWENKPLNVQIGTGAVNIDCQDVNVNATGTVNLHDGSDNKAVRGDDLKTWLDGHTHPSGMGPTGAPVTPLPPTALSSNVNLK